MKELKAFTITFGIVVGLWFIGQGSAKAEPTPVPEPNPIELILGKEDVPPSNATTWQDLLMGVTK